MSLVSFFSEKYNQQLIGYNDYILNYVINTNLLWEEKICNIIVDNIENNKEFIDIGANIGLISLGVNKIAKENGKNISNIHCFECDSRTFRILVDNTNFLTNSSVKLYPFALADKSKLCLMSENKYNYGCNFIYNTFDNVNSNNYNYPFIPHTNYYDKK
jgi:FkbM family methyltransferase